MVVSEGAPRPANPLVVRLMDVAEAAGDGQNVLSYTADVLNVSDVALANLVLQPEFETPQPGPGFTTASPVLGVVERVMPNGEAILFGGKKAQRPFHDLRSVR